MTVLWPSGSETRPNGRNFQESGVKSKFRGEVCGMKDFVDGNCRDKGSKEG